MTEYQFCGLLLFGCILATSLLYAACYCIEKSIRQRKAKQLKRAERRMKQTADYAEFVALSQAY